MVANEHVQVMIPPDAGKRDTPRPDGTAKRYTSTRNVLATGAAAGFTGDARRSSSPCSLKPSTSDASFSSSGAAPPTPPVARCDFERHPRPQRQRRAGFLSRSLGAQSSGARSAPMASSCSGGAQSGYSSFRKVRGSSGWGLGVRSSRKLKYGATNGSGALTV